MYSIKLVSSFEESKHELVDMSALSRLRFHTVVIRAHFYVMFSMYVSFVRMSRSCFHASVMDFGQNMTFKTTKLGHYKIE